MYKIFVGDIPIILSTKDYIAEDYFSAPIKECDLKKIIKKIKKENLKKVHLYHPKEHKLLKHFKKQIKPLTAGGGLVYNTNNEVLFIFRKGKWDLPKGHTKKNESIERSAIREVEEETGVKNLEIVNTLPTTYHIMKRKGKYRLKETFWFEMKTDYKGELKPQEEEDITKVEWKNLEESREALQNSFENIKMLFSKDYFKELQ